MTTFTKAMVGDIAIKLRKFLQDEGYTVGKINSSWSPFEDKLSIILKGTDESGEDQETQDYRYFQKPFGLPDALGKQMKMNGRTVTVTGYFSKRPKNSIRLMDEKGKVFLTTTETLQRVWARQEEANARA